MPTGLEHSKYFTPEQIEKKWEEYKQLCLKATEEVASAGKVVKISKPEIPFLDGFQLYLGISRQTWNNYEKAEGYEAYFDTIKKVGEESVGAKKRALINGHGSTTGLIFDLKVNHGMIERQIVDTNLNIKADFGTDIIHTTPEAEGNTSSPQ